MKTITTSDVKALKTESIKKGNHELAQRCDRALEGQQDAWWLVRSLLASRA